MSAIADLAAFIATPRPLADATRAAVRLHIVDTLGALIAATRTAEGQALLRFRGEIGAPADMGANLMTLCALTRLSEIDDIHLASMTTPGSIVIPGALTLAAARPLVDRDTLVDAILAGYEAMVRLGLAFDGPAILYRGIWTTYFAAPFGIAAVASRLLGLDASQTVHALALALTYTAPGVGHHNAPTTSRWIAAGHAARNGVPAAQAARAGFTADINMLDGGFFPGVYAITPKAAALTEELGSRDVLAEVSYKPWCAARQTMAATQALREIVDSGVEADAITAIEVAVLPAHLKMIDHGVTAGDRFSHLTSVQYNMAVAALSAEAAYELGGPPGGIPLALQEFMARIKVRADDGLIAAGYPKQWAARVTVTAGSGRHERQVHQVPGDPASGYGEAELRQKFRHLVTPVPANQADAMFARALGVLDQPAPLVREIESIDAG